MAEEFPGSFVPPEPDRPPDRRRTSSRESRDRRDRPDGRRRRCESDKEPRAKRAPAFIRVFIPSLLVLAGLALATFWAVVGGWPHDTAKYGTVPIPGAQTLVLDAG